MFGNRQGWMISVVLVGIFGVLIYSLGQMQNASPMTPEFAADPNNMAAIELPVAPETVVTNITEPGDAGDKYREAIVDFEANPTTYQPYNKTKTPGSIGVEAVLAGTRIKEMKLFSRNPKEIVNYTRDKDTLDAIKAIGEDMGRIGLEATKNKDFDAAIHHAEAQFALGMKLYQERLIFEELEAGMGEMGAGATLLKLIANQKGDTALADRCQKFDDARRAYSAKLLQTRRKWIPAIDGEVIGQHAGDVFALAQNSKERMWRIEAMLQMGKMRFSVGETGRAPDQRYANRLLKKFAETEKDEVVKSAATQARDLDLATYNNQMATGHAQQ